MIVRVPASTANLGPGFDSLGLALGLWLEASDGPIDGGSDDPIEVSHPTARAFAACGGEGPLWVRSPIPMGRGLGYSGAARVAGAVAAVARRDGGFDLATQAAEVFAVTADLEGHGDNVAASIHGGLVVTAGRRVVRVPLGLRPEVVCWIPDAVTTSTDASRGRLPAQVTFSDSVFNVARAALLVAALAAGDVGALREATADRLHQPMRFEAAPISRRALDLGLDAGAWCGWLSGSGPTVAMLCDRGASNVLIGAMAELPGHHKVLDVDHLGVIVR